jgi:hypothetical protein
MNDSLHSSVVISIVRMSLADKNLSDGQTQLLLRMGEGPWGPCLMKSGSHKPYEKPDRRDPCDPHKPNPAVHKPYENPSFCGLSE